MCFQRFESWRAVLTFWRELLFCTPAQASMLLEAESFAGRVQGGAESWAEQMEVLLTEELDGRIRAHRPRAGRIEEEVGAGFLNAQIITMEHETHTHVWPC